ncbi:MAG: membrane protein insertion efficiency factor YidD [Methylovirgula sp.]
MDLRLFPRRAAHYAIRAYQLSFSAFLGRQCRYLPSCSAYADEAITRHGLGPGSIMGLARLCRCHPWGNYGYDPVPDHLPDGCSWLKPWRYGQWRGPLHCEDVSPEGAATDKMADPRQDGQDHK